MIESNKITALHHGVNVYGLDGWVEIMFFCEKCGYKISTNIKEKNQKGLRVFCYKCQYENSFDYDQ